MLEMAINNVEMGSELDRVHILTCCVVHGGDGIVDYKSLMFRHGSPITESHNVYSVLFTTHLYIIDRHFKHIEPRLMILIFLDQKLNADSKNITFKIFFC